MEKTLKNAVAAFAQAWQQAMGRAVTVALLVFALLNLGGCYTGQTPATKSQQAQHHTLGKPGANVSLLSREPILLDALGEHSLVLRLRSSSFPGRMNLRIAADEGITLLSAAEQSIELTQAGEYELPVQLVAAQAGRHYLRLHVELNSDGKSEKRVLAAIVQVGKSAPPSVQKTSPALGDDVIALPAQEQVSPRSE